MTEQIDAKNDSDVTLYSPTVSQDLLLQDLTAQRDRAFKERHAYQAILKAHGLETKLDDSMLGNLSVDGNSVVGEYAYEAPKISAPRASSGRDASANKKLTRDDLHTMTEAEINDNWEEISAMLSEGRRKWKQV